MKTLQFTEVKNHFSTVLKEVENGNEIAISYGNDEKTIAVIISYENWIKNKKNKKRQLGTLEGKMSVEFAKDFEITDEELINL